MYKKIIISILLCAALLAQPFSYAHAETDQEVTGKSIEKTNDVEQNTDTTTGKMDDETASETKVQHTTDDMIAVYDSLDKTAGGILTNDSAYISSSVIIKKQTGTPYWDEEEGQGNDTGPDDNIVRSFDTVTYTIENTIKVNDTDHGSADAKKYYNFKGGKIYFEAYFPNEYQKVMHWNTESMKWASDLKTEGGKLTGYYQMPEGEITIPGKQTLVFPLKIDGAANGTEATPYFKIWLQGNDTNEMIQLNDTDGFTVTAKPSYNVKLQNWDSTTKWITWNDQDGQGDKSGRAYGYSLLLQLYNDNTKKGLKGIEYPQGDISYDLDFTLTRINRKTSKTEDITSASGMELYNYKENDYQRRAGKIPNRSMVWSVHSDRNYTIPGSDLVKLGQTKNDYYISRYVYNGGSISMKQTDQTLHVELSDYDFNGTFPWTTLGSESNDTTIRFGSNIGCFATDHSKE